MYEPGNAFWYADLAAVGALVLLYALALAVVLRRQPARRPGAAGAAATLLGRARAIDRRRLAIFLGGMVAAFTALGALVAYSTSEALHIYLFRLNDERTLPTSFNFFQLLGAGTIALLLAFEQAGRARYAWALLATAFAFAAIFEGGDVHGRFEARTGIPEELLLVPLAAMVLAALVVIWPQLRASRPAAPLFLGAAGLVVASQAFDLSKAIWAQRIVEESLELGAGALFVLSLLTVAQRTGPGRLGTGARARRRRPSAAPRAPVS